jgi:hypothetical protein
MNLHPQSFTFAGRLIVLIAVCIAVGGTVGLVAWPNEIFPAVRLPLFLVALPPLCVAGVFVALSMLVLKLFGLEFYFPSAEELEQ